jgi:hypothetical protein
MDNFTKVYGTKWTNDTYIEAQWTIKESIWKIWTMSINFMEPNGQVIIHGCKVDYKRIHMETYGQCQKTLWNPINPYRYL